MATKATAQTDRESITDFQQIINVGPATAGDFKRLGLESPADLIGKDPFEMYASICEIDGVRHDPCVIDVFMAAVDYMNGSPPKAWWKYTPQRKKLISEKTDSSD